jgi:16S rRNA processing protein RimM
MARPHRQTVEPAGAQRAAGGAVPADCVLLGAVAGAHGIRGAVKIKTFTADPADVASYGPLLDERGRRFAVKVERAQPGAVIARIDGVTDRNAAEALRGTRLYVSRAALPEPDEDEFYHADLLGLAVEDEAGAAIGKVMTVQDFGAGDVLEIRLAEGGTAWLPFTREMVPVVDIAGRRLVAAPPADWLVPPEDEGREEEGGSRP